MSLFVAKKIHDGSEPESPKSDGSSALPVDVYRYQQKLVIIAPIAGISIDDISVAITEDILTQPKKYEEDALIKNRWSRMAGLGDDNEKN